MNKPTFTKKQKRLGASILVLLIAAVLALANGKDLKQVFSGLFAVGLDEEAPDNNLPELSPSGTVTPVPTEPPAHTLTPSASTTPATPTVTPAHTPTLSAPTATTAPTETPTPEPSKSPEELVEEDGVYSTPELVAAYLHNFHKLPSNYITKNEAEQLGWDSKEGNLWDVTDKMSIGGSRFGNYEGLLPEADGRIWYECDVNYNGGYRGAERILYSNDGLIYYTDDHYKTFTKLY